MSEKVKLVKLVKELRQITGLSLLECKRALESTNLDLEKAIEFCTKNARPSHKPVGAGSIFSYVHYDRRIGVLVELHCATDFVARSEEFKNLGKNLTLQIAAMNPSDIEALLAQPFLKDSSTTVGKLVDINSAKFNEPIKIKRFQRYVLGVD